MPWASSGPSPIPEPHPDSRLRLSWKAPMPWGEWGTDSPQVQAEVQCSMQDSKCAAPGRDWPSWRHLAGRASSCLRPSLEAAWMSVRASLPATKSPCDGIKTAPGMDGGGCMAEVGSSLAMCWVLFGTATATLGSLERGLCQLCLDCIAVLVVTPFQDCCCLGVGWLVKAWCGCARMGSVVTGVLSLLCTAVLLRCEGVGWGSCMRAAPISCVTNQGSGHGQRCMFRHSSSADTHGVLLSRRWDGRRIVCYTGL